MQFEAFLVLSDNAICDFAGRMLNDVIIYVQLRIMLRPWTMKYDDVILMTNFSPSFFVSFGCRSGETWLNWSYTENLPTRLQYLCFFRLLGLGLRYYSLQSCTLRINNSHGVQWSVFIHLFSPVGTNNWTPLRIVDSAILQCNGSPEWVWQIAWIIPAFWSILAYALLAIICILWAPSRNPTRYFVFDIASIKFPGVLYNFCVLIIKIYTLFLRLECHKIYYKWYACYCCRSFVEIVCWMCYRNKETGTFFCGGLFPLFILLFGWLNPKCKWQRQLWSCVILCLQKPITLVLYM